MPRKIYVNVSLPLELIKEVDKTWKRSKQGYRSRAEFVMEAIRQRLKEET
jgi:metal-responsive CopG/Arc/MetJ family transcriptional regulator